MRHMFYNKVHILKNFYFGLSIVHNYNIRRLILYKTLGQCMQNKVKVDFLFFSNNNECDKHSILPCTYQTPSWCKGGIAKHKIVVSGIMVK
jgi:hypothetical protein